MKSLTLSQLGGAVGDIDSSFHFFISYFKRDIRCYRELMQFIKGFDSLPTLIGKGADLERLKTWGILSSSDTYDSATVYTLTGTCI